MSLKKINAALLTAYQASVTPTLPTAYEAKDFNPPSGPWARVINFPADKYVNSLGDEGQDKNTGFFQIDFFVPENDGTGRILGYADSALSYFRNGRRFYYQGQEVQVRRSSMSQIHRDETLASLGITLSIYWDAPSQR